MRKYLAILLLLVGCTQHPARDAAWMQKSEKVHVLSTLAMIHDLADEIGGEYVLSIPLIRGELDPHTYELVKGDDEKFQRADLILYNGLGLEHGLSLRQNLENNPKAVAVAEPILERKPGLILKVDGEHDPHVWMDIAIWMETVEPIVTALCEKDPTHAPYFRARGEALLERMKGADQEVYTRLQAIPSEKRYLVTSHDAFNYFTRHYLADPGESEWEKRCRAPEGLAPESQMSLSDVIDLITHVEQHHITVLFSESNVNRDALKKIVSAATEKGLPLRLSPHVLYGDAMGEAANYLEMVRHNVAVIIEELEK